MAWWYQTFGFALVAIFLLYRYFTRNFSYWRDLKVHYLKPTPFIGNCMDLLLLKKSSGQFLQSIYESGPGKPYVGFFIADKPALLARSPNLLCNILIKDFAYFADRFVDSSPHTDPLGTRNLFVIKGAEWRYLRNKLSPTFTSGKMKKMFYLVARCDQQMVDYLIGAVGKEGSVDMKEIAARCTTDVISNCAFGIESNTLKDPTSEFRELGKKTFEYTVKRAIEVLSFFFVPSIVKIAKFCFFQQETNDFLRRVFWDTLTAREQAKNAFKRNDLIDHLIQLKNEGRIEVEDEEVEVLDEDKNMANSFDFSGDDLVAQAAIFFAAGYETSASTMSFCLYEMATHPEMQQRLREEIADHLENTGGVITYEMVFGMQYLDMVIRETLRKYPTLPFLDRICLRDYKDPDSDLVIAKGTPVYVSVRGLHMDPEHFPDPERFDPERFQDKDNIASHTYLPFGEGPHVCIGMRFGLMSTKAGVVYTLSNFEVSPSAETPIPLNMTTRGIVITTIGGVPLKLTHSPLRGFKRH